MISRDALLARVADLLRRSHVDDAEELIGELGKRVIADLPPVVFQDTVPPFDGALAPPAREYAFDAAPNFPIRVPPGEYLALRVEPRKVGARITLTGHVGDVLTDNKQQEG